MNKNVYTVVIYIHAHLQGDLDTQRRQQMSTSDIIHILHHSTFFEH